MKENFSIDHNPQLQTRLKKEFNKIASGISDKDSNETIINKFSTAGLRITYQSNGTITAVAKQNSYDRWETAIYPSNELSLGVTIYKAHKEFQYEKKQQALEAKAKLDRRNMDEQNRIANLPPKKPTHLDKATLAIFNFLIVRIMKDDPEHESHETILLKFMIKSTLFFILLASLVKLVIFISWLYITLH